MSSEEIGGLWRVTINATVDDYPNSKLMNELTRLGIINVQLRNPKIAVYVPEQHLNYNVGGAGGETTIIENSIGADMKTLIDVFRQFHKMSEDGRFSANVRSLGFAIIAYWNEYGRKDEFDIYHDRLQNASGLSGEDYRLALDALSKRHIIKRTRTRRRGCARFSVEIARDGAKSASAAGDIGGNSVPSVSTRPQDETKSASASDARQSDVEATPTAVEEPVDDRPLNRRIYEASNVLVSETPGTERYAQILRRYNINYEQLFEWLLNTYPDTPQTEELARFLLKYK